MKVQPLLLLVMLTIASALAQQGQVIDNRQAIKEEQAEVDENSTYTNSTYTNGTITNATDINSTDLNTTDINEEQNNSTSNQGTTCLQKCGADATCKKNCQSSGYLYLIILPIIALLLFFVGCVFSLLFSCVKRYLEQKRIYKQLKKEYNNVENESMPNEEFIKKRDLVIEALRYGQYFTSGRYMSHVSGIKIVKQQPLRTQIQMKGKDCQGDWKARGYIVCRNNLLIFWFLKLSTSWFNKKNDQKYIKKEQRIARSAPLMKGIPRQPETTQYVQRWTMELVEQQILDRQESLMKENIATESEIVMEASDLRLNI